MILIAIVFFYREQVFRGLLQLGFQGDTHSCRHSHSDTYISGNYKDQRSDALDDYVSSQEA